MIKLIGVVVAWIILCGCVTRYEGSRVWVGPNEAVDWIDVGTLWNIAGGQWVPSFVDDSPIERIIASEVFLKIDEAMACGAQIVKGKSVWYVFSPTGSTEDMTLSLVMKRD